MHLPLLPEEAETQRGGGLILPLFPQGNDDEYRQRYHIGEHLVKLLDGKVGAGGNVEIQDVKPTEQDGSQHADVGPPDGT